MIIRKIPVLLLAFAASAVFAQSAQSNAKPAPPSSTAAKPATTPDAKATPATTAVSPDHASEADVRKLFEAMHLRENNEKFLKGIKPLLDREAKQQESGFASMDEKDRQFFEQVEQEEMDKLLNPAFIDELMKAATPAYAEHLTPEDVRQATAFYNSPAGQHFESQMPEISKQSMQVAMPLVQQRARDAAADQQKKLSEYMTKKYGTTAPTTTAPTSAPSGASAPATTAPAPATTTPAPTPKTTPAPAPKG